MEKKIEMEDKAKKKSGKAKSDRIKDTIIVLLFVVLLIMNLTFRYIDNGSVKKTELPVEDVISETGANAGETTIKIMVSQKELNLALKDIITDVLEQTILIFGAFIGVLSIFQSKGWDNLVPSFMLKKQEEKQKKLIQEAVEGLELPECISKTSAQSARDSVDQFYKNELGYIQANAEARTNYILSLLGITAEKYEYLRQEIIKMRGMPLVDLNDARNKLRKYLTLGEPYIYDVKKMHIPPADLKYKEYRYFINFNTIMFLPEMQREFSAIMKKLICENIKLSDFDKIIVPYDSNLVLGYVVGSALSKPVVHMRPNEGRIESVKPWDGELKDGDKAIIVHDVLVSATQINHVYDHVLQTVEIKGVFCLVTRTDQSAKGKEILAENKRRLYQVLETDDNAITVLRHQKKDR